MTKKFLSILLALSLVLTFTVSAAAASVDAASSAGVAVEQSAALTFSDSGITETSSGSGYTIDGTSLTITTAGTYRISGSCSEGAVIGAVILLSTSLSTIHEVYQELTAPTSINPLKILILFFSMTILSIYLDEVGLFRFLAGVATKKAKGNQLGLFFAIYGLTSILTIFTSNDIVILTLTPFICFFAKNAKINPLPYLITEFAAANTWSMMLIIGNPTNIYLASSAGIDFLGYFKVMLIPTLFAGLTELLVVFLVFRKQLKAPMCAEGEEYRIESKPDLILGVALLTVCLVLMAISSYVPFEMWMISAGCAVAL